MDADLGACLFVPALSKPPCQAAQPRLAHHNPQTSCPAVNTFAGLGDGDFFSGSPVESVVMSIYLLFNVVLGAYILGTVTMVR